MSKAIPPVQKFMTYQPHTINAEQTIEHAQRTMRELRVRHLPVLKGGKLVGLLSDRDINLVLSFESPEAAKMQVEEACTERPYTTSPQSPLNEVVAHMAEKKFGSAIVMDNNKVVGIFTDVDAMRALAELLETRLSH
jgi:acetoin utilization protein AcuB